MTVETLTPGGALDALLEELQPRLADYPYDHYRLYPAADRRGWEALALKRISDAAGEQEGRLLRAAGPGGDSLLMVRARAADAQRLGVPTASLEILHEAGDGAALRQCLAEADAWLRQQDIAFVQTRVNGDQLHAVHAMQDEGFHYYENILWPTVRCADADPDFAQYGAREMQAGDVEAVMRIAETNQFARGHFYCDPGFDAATLNRFYGQWLKGAFERGQPVIVIEDEGEVAGYFALEMPEHVSAALGTTYGGMRSLGLRGSARGKGLGIRIFRAAVAYLRSRGAEIIDSGYASKNHISARLHMLTGFSSVYEEVTLHRWIKAG